MLNLKWNLDPTLQRVAFVALLLMLELILVKLLEILSSGRQPTIIEIEYISALGLLQLVTYILAFVRKETEG